MDSKRFDDLTRGMAANQNRRSLLKRISVAAAGGIAATFSLTRASLADSCQPGNYLNNTVCTPCAPGTISIQPDQNSCFGCSAGQYQPASGQTDCLGCAAGEYQPSEGQVSCLACAAGSVTTSFGSTTCTPCAAGKFESENA